MSNLSYCDNDLAKNHFSVHADCMTKKKSKFSSSPPIASDINEANALISELWEQLRHYEDRLKNQQR